MEVVKKYGYQSDEVIRTSGAKLEQRLMKPGQDPDECFLKAARYRAKLRRVDEPITDRHFKGIIMQDISSDYDSIKLFVYRDPSFDLDKIQPTMRNVYRDYILGTAKQSIMTSVRLDRRKGDINNRN